MIDMPATQLDRATDAPLNKATAPRRILIVDDHPVFRYGIAALIAADETLPVCGEEQSAPQGPEPMPRHKTDAALLDMSLSVTHGL